MLTGSRACTCGGTTSTTIFHLAATNTNGSSSTDAACVGNAIGY